MRRAIATILLLLGLPLSVVACLWDRDTPASEAKGMPEVVAVLTGRFPRNPPLFYEMRLERVSAHLRSYPEDLEAYDDASVACDRLGRGDEAIAWMEKKRGQLGKLDPALTAVKDHKYRYHANLGTFLAHRWVRHGADRAKIDEVKAVRNQIAKALEINPKAHFGREAYQLRALDWILHPPGYYPAWQPIPNLLGWSFDDIYGEATEPKDAHEAVLALTGIVVLGNAWENVDIFHALNVALQRDSVGYARGRDGGRNTLAYFAWLRCRELVDAGKGSMYPGTPKGEKLKEMLHRPEFVKPDLLLDPAFAALREEAEAWQAERTAFMTKRLKEGRHPDTDRDFWRGYTERPTPSLPGQSVPEAYKAWFNFRMRVGQFVIFGIPLLLSGFLIAWSIVRSKRARRRKAQVAKTAAKSDDPEIHWISEIS